MATRLTQKSGLRFGSDQNLTSAMTIISAVEARKPTSRDRHLILQPPIVRMESDNEYQRCACCGKEASLTCTGCNQAPDGHGEKVAVTKYCEAACQQAHWGDHKKYCVAARHRRSLHRSAETLQQLYYTFKRITHIWPISKVEKDGIKWIAHLKLVDRNFLMPIPTDLFPTERDQQTAMCFNQCSKSVAQMGATLKSMLKGLCFRRARVQDWVKAVKSTKILIKNAGTYSSINEVTFAVNMESARIHIVEVWNPKPNVEKVLGDLTLGNLDAGEARAHTAFRVTLKNGEQYAIDLTGAQFGNYETIVPWELYAGSRVRRILQKGPLGSNKTRLEHRNNSQPQGWIFTERVVKAFQAQFETAVARWQSENLRLDVVMGLPAESYMSKRRALVEQVEEALQKCRDAGNQSGWREFF